MIDVTNLGRYAVFSIDMQHDPIHRAAFVAAWASAKREGRVQGNAVPLIGSYKGETEFSFVAEAEDFWTFAYPLWSTQQESVLFVSECNKQYATLLYLADGRTEPLGSLKSVSEAEAKRHDAWSHNPRTGCWFVATDDNPDDVEEIGAPLDAPALPATPPALAYRPAHGGYPVAPALRWRGTPEDWSALAERLSREGMRGNAFDATRASYRARAEWFLLNGQWVRRAEVRA